MSLYFMPALASLLFKLFVLLTAARGGKVSLLLLSLIFVFAFHNAIELGGYIQFLNGHSLEAFFRPYYVATIYLLMYMLLHGLAISRLENIYTTISLVSSATILSVLVLFTDIIVAGQYSIGYSVAAVKGPYYGLFMVFLLATLFANIAALLYRYRSASSPLESIRCLYSLFALSPVILVALLVITLKINGIDFNAAILGPVATALFLVIVIKGESKHKLSDVRRLLPFSPERTVANNLMTLVDGYVHNGHQTDAYKNLHIGIEKEIIFYTLNKCNNNITQTTEMMGLKNRSTLYSMMSRLGIDLQGLKDDQKIKSSK
jgi:DNA-binding protein Fis